jgi:hypothetical protein
LKKTILFLALLTLSACTQKDNISYDLRNEGEKPQYILNKPAGNKQDVVRDDITNQNPNFLHLNKSGDGANQETDTDKARQVINNSKEFTPGSVRINGDDMWITVYKQGNLNNKDKIDAEARIHRDLVRALPRYNIEVNVQEDRS